MTPEELEMLAKFATGLDDLLADSGNIELLSTLTIAVAGNTVNIHADLTVDVQ